MKVTIIVPVLNEKENLELLLPELYKVILNNSQYEFEVLVVDDGSSDGTLDLLKSDTWKDAGIKYISLTQPYGSQLAILAGYDKADGDLLLTMAGDGRHSPSYIIPMIETYIAAKCNVLQMIPQSSKADIGYGFRYFLYRLYAILTGIPVPAMGADFRLISSKLKSLIHVHRSQDTLFRVLFPLLGASIEKMDFYPRPISSRNTRNALSARLKTLVNAITYSRFRLSTIIRMLIFSGVPIFFILYLAFQHSILDILPELIGAYVALILGGFAFQKFRFKRAFSDELYELKDYRLGV